MSEGDLHISLTVLRDSGERQLPTTYIRDRLAFSGPEEAESYQARLLAWIAARPAPGEPELALPAWRPELLDAILSRMDEWAPMLPNVFDWEQA